MKSEWYPVDWQTIAAIVKESNNFVCQACNVECRRESTDRSKPVLTVAHITQDYEADWIQLSPLCVVCHLRFDAPFGWQARRRHERERRRQAGQLEMLFQRRKH